MTLREAWLYDAFQLRNEVGHGKVHRPRATVWTLREHLLIGALVVPLLAKAVLRDAGLYACSRRDDVVNLALDTLMTWEPFARRPEPRAAEDDSNPWRGILAKATMWPSIREMAAALRALDQQRAAKGAPPTAAEPPTGVEVRISTELLDEE